MKFAGADWIRRALRRELSPLGEEVANIHLRSRNLPVTIGSPDGDYPNVMDVRVAPADEGEAAYIEVE